MVNVVVRDLDAEAAQEHVRLRSVYDRRSWPGQTPLSLPALDKNVGMPLLPRRRRRERPEGPRGGAARLVRGADPSVTETQRAAPPAAFALARTLGHRATSAPVQMCYQALSEYREVCERTGNAVKARELQEVAERVL